jgi:hypothetical protein
MKYFVPMDLNIHVFMCVYVYVYLRVLSVSVCMYVCVCLFYFPSLFFLFSSFLLGDYHHHRKFCTPELMHISFPQVSLLRSMSGLFEP